MYPFRAFLSVFQLANATRTGLKIEIETVGTTSKFRGSQSVEKRSNFSCQVAATIFLVRTKTLFRKLSIYLRTSASSFHSPFFFLPFAQLFFFFFFGSQTLPHSLPLFLSNHSHIARRATGVVFFEISWHRVRVSFVFPYKVKRFVCHLSPVSFHLRKSKTEIRRFVSHSEMYAKLAVLGNISSQEIEGA